MLIVWKRKFLGYYFNLKSLVYVYLQGGSDRSLILRLFIKVNKRTRKNPILSISTLNRFIQ